MENAITSHFSFSILPLQTLPYSVTQALSDSYFTTFMPQQKQYSIIFSSFYLTITVVTHHGSYLWCNIHISKYTNVQILNKTGKSLQACDLKSTYMRSYRLTTAHIFRNPTTTPQLLMCSIKKN